VIPKKKSMSFNANWTAKTRDFVAEGILDVPMQIYKAEGAGPKNAYGRHR
jgi:hypothetical protein